MSAYIFNKYNELLKNARKAIDDSQKWFSAAAGLTVSTNKLLRGDRPRLLPYRRISRIHIGRMIMFLYDPKTKQKLPYYDRFPLVIPIQIYNDGFLGLNLHYLPHRLRASLLDSLYELYNNKHMDEKKKLTLSYNILQTSMRIRFYQPTIKRYLLNHFRSKIYVVDPAEWDKVLLLPTEKFVGASRTKVWADSMNKLGIGR